MCPGDRSRRVGSNRRCLSVFQRGLTLVNHRLPISGRLSIGARPEPRRRTGRSTNRSSSSSIIKISVDVSALSFDETRKRGCRGRFFLCFCSCCCVFLFFLSLLQPSGPFLFCVYAFPPLVGVDLMAGRCYRKEAVSVFLRTGQNRRENSFFVPRFYWLFLRFIESR